jgi:small subunit ribosomal protein S6
VHTYETIFITRPTLSEDEEKATLEALSEVVRSGGGELVHTDRMGRRRLCFPIAKQHDGVYTRLLYDSEPAVPKELDRRSRLSDEVLRMLTVRLEPDWAEAAKVQAKEDVVRMAAEHEERKRQESEITTTGLSPVFSSDSDDEFGDEFGEDVDDDSGDSRRRR